VSGMTASDNPFVIFAIVLSDFFEWRLLNPFVIFAIVLSDFFEWRLLTRLLSLPLYCLTSLNDGFWTVCYLCHCIVWLLLMTVSDPFVIFAILFSVKITNGSEAVIQRSQIIQWQR
jgi:hypothetical protein